MTAIRARVLAGGAGPLEATGTAFAVGLSFWGGVDPQTGRVRDPSHPGFGRCLAGRVLAMPSGRGSGSSASVLAEAIRIGTAPAAILLARPDPILVAGAMVAEALYARCCPVLLLAAWPGEAALDGRPVRIAPDGSGAIVAWDVSEATR